MLKLIYQCSICGWVGDEPKMIPGILWDYDEHESCPICWEYGVHDIPVELIICEHIEGTDI